VALDDHVGVQGNAQFLADFGNSLSLVLPAAVCKKDEWDPFSLQKG
jgi:hypothetical protein